MASLRYDDAQYCVPQTLVCGGVGITVNGTIATTATIFAIKVPRAMKVTRVSVYESTGGTGAGPLVTIGKSLAGTGTVSNFGTANLAGTVADATGFDMTLTATALADGDFLVIQKVAGTAAAAPIANFAVEYQVGMFDGA